MSDLEDLPASILGTKEHWDGVYERELETFEECGDEGEIWFGTLVERRIVNWIKNNLRDKSTKIIEFGSGNGHLLVSLAKGGFTNVCGIDYSEGAVNLGKKLSESEMVQIHFEQGDLLDSNSILPTGPSFVIDKGTFDAISLSFSSGGKEEEEMPVGERRIDGLCQKFKEALSRVECEQFMITSCNWTQSELISLFSPEFEKVDSVSHASSFVFGGREGETVTTLLFKPSLKNQ